MIDILILIFTYLPSLFVHLVLLCGLVGILFSMFSIPIAISFITRRP
jgi:hypothetical protein